MRLVSTKRFQLGIAAVLMALLIPMVSSHVAHAFTWEGPMKFDNNNVEFIRNGSSTAYGDSYPNASRQMEYVVSNDDFTDIRQTDILVYTPNKYGSIRIINKDLCTNTQTSIPNSDANYAPNMPQGTFVTEYRLIRPDGVSIKFGQGYWDYTGPGACAGRQLDMSPTSPFADSVQPDPDTGLYVYRIRANALLTGGKFANGFHITASNGSYISQDSSAAASSFGLQPSYPVPGNNPVTPTPPDPYRVYTDLDIPFGPDCSLTAGQTTAASFDIYDADNNGNYDVQPQPFHVQLLRHNRATGAYIGPVPLSLTLGSAVQVAPTANQLWRPTGASQTTTRLSFTANGSETYKLRVYNLYYDNTLQFKIPYDSVWFFRQCAGNTPKTVRPVATMTPTSVEVGGTLTATASAQNLTTNGGTARVNYGRLVWNDANRNDAYDAGERVFSGPDAGTVDVPQGGSYNFTTWSETADTARHGGRVCIRLSLAAVSLATTIEAPDARVSCADIGKKPKLFAADGDVVAGGTFPNGSGVCPTPSVTGVGLGVRGSTSVFGGVTYSSLADYGVFSLGQINTFGANGQNPQTPLSNYLSYGNIPAPLGSFMGTSSPVRCLNNPFTAFGSRAVAVNNNAQVDICDLGADTILNGRDVGGKIILTCGSVLSPGERRVVYVKNADEALIQSNISYDEGPYGSVNDIPQLVVLSDQKITVRENVTRLDGIYAARTDFQTCDVRPTLSRCNQRLEVNGAIIAGERVLPYRTAGAEGPNYGDKAEIFRLRSDVLLNQLPAPGDEVLIRTIDQREVPARF